jgi:hypothetical protein
MKHFFGFELARRKALTVAVFEQLIYLGLVLAGVDPYLWGFCSARCHGYNPHTQPSLLHPTL